MELLTLQITPKSSFSTIPKGDTIFGQILSFLFLKGDTTFENYLNSEPKLIVSDMMPYGYVYRPILPLDCFKTSDEKKVNKKEIRKSEFISLENFQKGDLHLCENISYIEKNSVVKNSVNRVSFTTDGADFAPYGNNEYSFSKKLWMFILVDKIIKGKILEVISDIGKFGFGKDASTGKGIFDFKIIDTPIKKTNSNYFMSLSPTILENQKFENIWYEPFTRFGKFGLNHAHTNAFKKPILMADSSAVIKSNSFIQYFGKSVNNGTENKPSFLQGYSIVIPFKIKDEKWLGIK